VSPQRWISGMLNFARELQLVSDMESLLEVAHVETCRFTRYRSTCFYILKSGETIELLGVFGRPEGIVRRAVPYMPAKGDAYIEDVIASREPVIVEDARVDPRTNKELVKTLGNRTMIHIPLMVGDDRLGAFGTGTFHPEEVMVPTPEELDFLILMASQLSMAMSRLQANTKRQAAERRLQQAQRLEEMGRLAGGIAHDFGNLLGAIVGYVALASEDIEADHPAQKHLDQALRVTERGARLTRQLLGFSGKKTAPARPFLPQTLLRSVAGMLERLLPSDIQLELSLDDGVGHIVGEPSQLEQIVMNLVLNARDAIGSSGRIQLTCSSISIGTERAKELQVEPGTFVEFCVEDSGSGMDPETRSRIFEPFFSTKARDRGTGLGLAVVQSIVQQYRGWIQVESELGKGSTFRVYCPQVQGFEAEPVSPLPQRLSQEPGARLLVVDDDIDLLNMLAVALTRAGYVVDVASNGREALDHLQNQPPPSLLLTDVVMPELDGVQLVAELSSLGLKVPVVFMSSHSLNDLATRLAAEQLEVSSRRLLPKPFQLGLALSVIEEALRV
jgi:signal transduction histidine kinase